MDWLKFNRMMGHWGEVEGTPAAWQQAAPQRVHTPQAARERAPQEEPKLIPLGVKFDRDPQQLGFFLAHVLAYMQVYVAMRPKSKPSH